MDDFAWKAVDGAGRCQGRTKGFTLLTELQSVHANVFKRVGQKVLCGHWLAVADSVQEKCFPAFASQSSRVLLYGGEH